MSQYVAGFGSRLPHGSSPAPEAKRRSMALHRLGDQPVSLQSRLRREERLWHSTQSYGAAGLNAATATVGNDGN